jgi:hypothetical protein
MMDRLPPEFNPNLRENPDDTIEERARKRVAIRARARAQFARSAVLFGVGTGICWIGFGLAAQGGPQFPWPFIVMIVLGLNMLRRGWEMYQTSAPALDRHENEVQREIDREMRRQEYTKAKRGLPDDQPEKPMRISDEGELVPADEVDDESDDQDDQMNDRPKKTMGQTK